jgi:hypothetical protein
MPKKQKNKYSKKIKKTQKPTKTRKKLSESHKKKISQSVSRYHKNCKNSMSIMLLRSKIKKQKKKLDEIKKK